MPIYPHLNLIFIHIPKTGGSSINEYFNLKKIIDSKSVKGDFICERQLPGFVRGERGRQFVHTSTDLRKFLSKGDYIRIGDYIYQVHSQRGLGPKKIFLAYVTNADNLMKGTIATRNGVFLGNNGKHKIYKKLVSDPAGNKIIPSIYHWGWIVTKTKTGQNLKQVYDRNIIRERGNPSLELDHLSLLYIKSRINPDLYLSYFKFCFVRNPYDRLVSEYFWKIKDNDLRLGIDCRKVTFKAFVYYLRERFPVILSLPHYEVSHFLPQYLFVCDESKKLIVDMVFKYENGLDNEFILLLEMMGKEVPPNFNLPNNNTTRSKRKKYTEYYDKETQDIVYSLYEDDFKLFDYPYELEP